VFRDKTADEAFKGPLAVRNAPEPCQPQAFHPRGKNPGDIFTLDGRNVGTNVGEKGVLVDRTLQWRPQTRLLRLDGKNPGDIVGYDSKYAKHDYGQTVQGFIRSQSQLKERLKSRAIAKQLFPNDPEKQQEYINFVHDHYSDPKGPSPRDILKLDSVACPSGPQRWEREGTNRVEARFNRVGKNPRDVTKIGTHHGSSLSSEGRATHYKGQLVESHPFGANPGDFWSINTKPYKGAHFAVYPVEICIDPILSSCPPGGVVLDPMCGSGSTLVAAKTLGRKWIGIDINGDYVKLALERLAKISTLDSYLPG